jgi:hypothetical protein
MELRTAAPVAAERSSYDFGSAIEKLKMCTRPVIDGTNGRTGSSRR